jgi:hypothetical protein
MTVCKDAGQREGVSLFYTGLKQVQQEYVMFYIPNFKLMASEQL